MNKEILSEIHRIKEIMGLELITEGVLQGWFETIVKNLLVDAETDNTVRGLISDVIERSGRTFNDAQSIIDDIISGNKKPSDFDNINWIEMIDEIISNPNNRAYRDTFFNTLETVLPQTDIGKTLKSLDPLEQSAWEATREANPQLYEETLTDYTNIKQEIEEFFRDDVDFANLLKKQAGLDDLPSIDGFKIENVVRPAGKEMADWIQGLVDDRKYLKQVGYWYSEIMRWYDTFSKDIRNSLTSIRAEVQKYTGKVIPEENWGRLTTLQKIEELSKEITEKMTRSVEEGSPEVSERLLRRITELVYSLKENANGAPMDILNNLKKDGKISDEVYNELIKDSSKFQQWWKEVVDRYGKKIGQDTKVVTSIATVFDDEFNAYIKMIPLTPIFKFVFKDLAEKGFKEGFSGMMSGLGESMTRIFWSVVWNDPRLPKEVLALRNARGTGVISMLGGVMISHLFFGNVIVPAILAFCQQAKEAIQNFRNDESIIYGDDEIPNFSVLDYFFRLYGSYGGPFVEKEDKTAKDIWLNNVLFFTKVDNVADFVYRFFKQGKGDLSELEKYVADLETTAKKVAETTDKVVDNASNAYKEAKQGVNVDSTEVQNKLDEWLNTFQDASEDIQLLTFETWLKEVAWTGEGEYLPETKLEMLDITDETNGKTTTYYRATDSTGEYYFYFDGGTFKPFE